MAAVASIAFEIGVGGHDNRVGEGFTHADEAGIGQAHGDVGVFGTQIKHLEQFVGQVQSNPQMSLTQQLIEGVCMEFVREKERLRQCGFASEPRPWLAGKSFPCPAMMLLARVKQCDQRAAVSDAAFWHG